jgi:hypothetical protein
MTTYLDVKQFETYVAACARNSGVTVEWDNADGVPRTDGKQMWLPAITSSSSDEWLARMRYFVKHETSHVVYSDFDYLNEQSPTGMLALLNNLIEDHRIDFLNDSEYIGDRAISNAFWTLHTADIKKRMGSKDSKLQEQQLLVLPVFAWEAANRDWITTSHEALAEMLPLLDTAGRERYAKLQAYTDELLHVREHGGAVEVMDLAKKILRDLYDEDPEKYLDKDKSEGKGKGEGKGDADGEEGGKPVDDDVDRLIEVDKLVAAMGHEHKASRTGIHLKHVEKGSGVYAIPTPDEYYILGFNDPVPAVMRAAMDSHPYFKSNDVENYITSNAKPLSNKLRIKLQTRSRDRYEYGKKRGKLHNGSLHRVLQKDSPMAERVFRQRVTSDTLDTAVCLLVDCSGSMSGDKFEMACAGAGALAEALKPLNIAYSVYGFTNLAFDRLDNPVVWLFSEFGERVPQPALIKRFKVAASALWDNSDGDAIAYASYRLSQRKEHRKVLIVLSDGSPAGRERAGDVTSYTHKAVLDAENMGIDTYGIGIRDNNVRHFYKKHVIVDKLDKLSSTILSVVDRSI